MRKLIGTDELAEERIIELSNLPKRRELLRTDQLSEYGRND